MLFDILIRVRDELRGLDRAKDGFRQLNERVAKSTKGFSSQAASILGATTALAAIGLEIRRVIRDIDTIPGVPQETIDSIHEAKQAFAEAREVLDQWIASGASFVSRVGQGLGYLAGAVAYGWDNATDAYGRSAAAARDVGDAADDGRENLAALAEAVRAAAAAARELAAAGQAADLAFTDFLHVGETEGARAVRLREESDELLRQAAVTTDIVEQQRLQAEAFRRRAQAKAIELQLTDQLNDASAALSEREFSRLSPTERLAILDAQIAALRQQTSDFTGGDAVAAERQVEAEQQLLDLLRQRDQAQSEIDAGKGIGLPELASGPGRNDLTGQVQEAIVRLPTLAESAGQAVQSAYAGIYNSIFAGLDGLWNRTMDLGDALVSIAQGFGQAFIRSLGEIVAQYAAKKAVMFAIDQVFAAKSLALSIASAAKSLVAWIPSAIAAGISSFGTAAAIGTAAVVAALAAFGGFETGGFTGGREGSPAGIVHGQEFVFSAPAVRSIGAGNLSALHAAALSPAHAAAPAPGGGERQAVNVAIVDRHTSAEDFLESSRGQKFLYDRFRQFMREVG